ncbi:hypothetical protein SASPL_151076 [Salvia splendens]|uniref:Uncharacterized protein n=1 Tax=Salvia splendens TaxID=180675 RepID=A0A8X8W8J3_SALSN|nr:hypothetical protein SASPL_151076 [Salvia splendens]
MLIFLSHLLPSYKNFIFNFISGERDMLIEVLNSRVIDSSIEAGGKSSTVGSPDLLDKAVQQAKKWFQEKKAGLGSVTELAQGSSNLNSTMIKHEELQRVRSRAEEDTVCSPSTKPDPSHFAAAQIKIGSAEAFAVGEGLTEPQSLRIHNQDDFVDAGISCLAGWLFHNVRECSASKLIPLPSAHDLLSSQVSLSRGVTQHNDQMENHMPSTPNVNINLIEGNCQLLSESHVEVPSMSKASTSTSGCQTSSFGRKACK